MTTIQPHHPTASVPDPSLEAGQARARRDARENNHDLARRDPRRDAGREQAGLGLGAGGTETGEREERFRRMLSRLGETSENGREDEARPASTRLLAEREPLPLFPVPAASSARAEANEPAGARAERMDRVAAAVETAMRAELRGVPNAAVTVRLDAALLEGSGLSAIAVTIGEGVVDVVLQRAPGEAAGTLMAGAQALADRLQQRFGRRIVRVHEAEPAGAAALEAGGDERRGPPGVFALFDERARS